MAERVAERVELLTPFNGDQLLNVSCTGMAIITQTARQRGELIAIIINGMRVNGYVVYSYPRKTDFRTGIRFDDVDTFTGENLEVAINDFACGIPLSFSISDI